ncbi:MAG: N-acetylglucosamine-6-phosphate deacetylase [Chloroflexota bacterium]
MDQLLIKDGRIVAPAGIIARGWVSLAAGKIAAIGSGDAPAAVARGATVVDASGLTVCPGFIDLHVHGGGGGHAHGGSPASILRMVGFHARHGTTGMLVTTGAALHGELLAAIRAACDAAASPDGGNILGVHLEGPYLSPKYKGAQPERFIRPAALTELQQLLQVCPGFVRLVTLAPEVPGGLAAVDYLRRQGVIVAMGHTDATYDQAEQAIAAGVSHAAHMFSAMRPFHHREAGVVGAALLDQRVTAELICDNIHVRPEAARILLTMKGSAGICLVTDAIAAAGQADGPAELFGEPITVAGGAARLPDGTLAGSTLTLDRAVGNLVRSAGVSLSDAVRMASSNPARVLGLADRKGELSAGFDADIVLLDDDYAARMTIIAGRAVGPDVDA